MKNNKLKLKNNSGFTLIEMVIVVVFVSMTFIAIYQLFASTVKQDTESRYEIIASNLAQEGVEMIRNMRDENELDGLDINDSINDPCYPYADSNGKVHCYISSSYNKICTVGGKYANSNCAPPYTFTRECRRTNVSGNEEIRIECTVGWYSFVNPNLHREVKAESYLTDWWK